MGPFEKFPKVREFEKPANHWKTLAKVCLIYFPCRKRVTPVEILVRFERLVSAQSLTKKTQICRHKFAFGADLRGLFLSRTENTDFLHHILHEKINVQFAQVLQNTISYGMKNGITFYVLFFIFLYLFSKIF